MKIGRNCSYRPPGHLKTLQGPQGTQEKEHLRDNMFEQIRRNSTGIKFLAWYHLLLGYAHMEIVVVLIVVKFVFLFWT